MELHPLNMQPALNPEPETPAPPSRLNTWLHTHPYASIALGACLLLLLGTLIYAPSLRVEPQQGTSATWGGSGSIFQQGTPAGQPTPQTPISEPTNKDTGPYVPVPIYSGQADATADGYDIEDLLLQLTEGVKTAPISNAGEKAIELDPWAGFTLTVANTGVGGSDATGIRSASQEAIATYGNATGNKLKNFEVKHSNAQKLVSAHTKNRTDQANIAALQSYAAALQAFGRELKAQSGVPTEMAQAHLLYAQSYTEMGTKLSAVALSSSDASYLETIATYNSAVEQTARRFTVLVGLFSAHNIRFTDTEGGAAFMFNAGASL